MGDLTGIHNQIKPKVLGNPDFYSTNLWRWIKRNKSFCRIYSGTWNSLDGINPERPTLYIGAMHREGGFSGRQLTTVCRGGRCDYQTYAYHNGHDTKNWTDVTDRFIEDYLRIGVCAIHGDYAHDWDVSGVTDGGGFRLCKNCNKVERKTIELRPYAVWS